MSGFSIKTENTTGTGDMTKAVYDTNNNGIVDRAELLAPAAADVQVLTSQPTGAVPLAIATTQYADNILAANDALVFKGGIDASSNPDYPAADTGHTYKISVAGKIGGASGVNVDIGDTLYCIVDGSVAGDQATVGVNWVIVQSNLEQATETTVGYSKIATQALADAGTDDVDYITSLKLENKIFDNIQFKTSLVNPSYVEGMYFYDQDKKALSYYNDVTDITVNTGQEVLFRVENQTGATIPNGTVIYPDPTTVIGLADAQFKEKSRVIAVATHDILDGSTGYATKLGQVGGLDTSMFSAGQIVYLGAAGQIVATTPTDGGYVVTVGVVDTVSATEGIITVDTNVSDLTVEVTDTNGFPTDQRDGTTLSADNGTRTFTIAPTGVDFHFYELGDKYEVSGSESVVWDNLEGEHWFYYASGVLTAQHEPTNAQKEFIILNNAFIATVYWNLTDQKVEIDVLDERHGIGMSPATHLNLHLTRGAQYVAGLGIGDIDADASGNANTSAYFSVASGRYFDEDIDHVIDALGVPATIPVIYNLGANADVKTATNANFAVHWNQAGGRIYYNEFTGGAWQLTEVPNNDFCLYHIFAMNGQSVGLVSVMGQNNYGTIAQARAGATTEISDLDSRLPFAEMIPIGTIIYQTSDGYANDPKARIRTDGDGNDYLDWRTTELAQGTNPSSHLNLTDLQLADTTVTWGHVSDQTQSIYGEKTFTDDILVGSRVSHSGDIDTYLEFTNDFVTSKAGGVTVFQGNATTSVFGDYAGLTNTQIRAGGTVFINTGVGGTSTTTFSTSGMNINGTVAIDGFIDDDTFATASATTGATSESIKAYADSLVTAGVTASNGLTKVATDIQLGGALTSNTVINGSIGSYSVDYSLLSGFSASVGDGGSYAGWVKVLSSQVELNFQQAGSNAKRLTFDGTDMTVLDSISSKGLIYGGNYSSNFVDRSLIDKGFADFAYSPLIGSANITTLGTIGTGVWNGTAITDTYISSAATWNAKQDALTFGIGDTNSVVMDSITAVSGDYVRLTSNGLEALPLADAQSSLNYWVKTLNDIDYTAEGVVSTYNNTNQTDDGLAFGEKMFSLGYRIFSYNTRRDFDFIGWSRLISGAHAPMMTIAQNGIDIISFEGNQQNGQGRVFVGTDSGSKKLNISGDAGYSATTDMGADDTDFASKKYVDDLTAFATSTETTTGIETAKSVTPDSLAGSDFGKRIVGIQVEAGGTDLATGDALNGNFFRIPSTLNGYNLVGVSAVVDTAGTTGTTDIQVRNVTQTADMLSTKMTIDSAETDTSTAATPAVIDTANDDVATADKISIDVDAISTTTPKGLYVELIFQLP